MGTAEVNPRKYMLDMETQFSDPQLNHQIQSIVDQLNQFISASSDATTSLDTVSSRPYSARLGITSAVTGHTEVPDYNNGSVFDLDLTADVIMSNPQNFPDGRPVIFRVKQGTGGGFVLSFGDKYRGGDTIAIADIIISSVAGKTDYVGFLYNQAADKYDLQQFTQGYV
jgi:hypothetical protein